VSTLRSALDELRMEDVSASSDQELEDGFAEVQSAAEALECERLRRLAEIDRRRSFVRRGYLSASAWLTDRFRMAFSGAARLLRVARALEDMPLTRGALDDAEISPVSAHVLASAREAHPEEFDGSETLLEAARTLSVRDLRRAVAYWSQAVDHRASLEEADRLWERRRLHVSATFGGMVRVDGDLDPETGQTLITALRSVQDAEARGVSGEPRSQSQRRADSLGEICRNWLHRSDRPQVAGERPHVTVLVGLEALTKGTGKPSEFEDVGVINAEAARRWACDASVSRLITAGASEPLDVGRRTSVVPPAIRRAVVVRDRECRFPGCDRPAPWCDAHHVVHWADGGHTALSNLVLLCRRHHRMVHAPDRFTLEVSEGRFLFRAPDSLPLEERAPP
jgi:Domain of unknown function (DUF222)/HNH endonuclease